MGSGGAFPVSGLRNRRLPDRILSGEIINNRLQKQYAASRRACHRGVSQPLLFTVYCSLSVSCDGTTVWSAAARRRSGWRGTRGQDRGIVATVSSQSLLFTVHYSLFRATACRSGVRRHDVALDGRGTRAGRNRGIRLVADSRIPAPAPGRGGRRRPRSSNAGRGTIPSRERRRGVARTDRSGSATGPCGRAPQERRGRS